MIGGNSYYTPHAQGGGIILLELLNLASFLSSSELFIRLGGAWE
jgi:hypothetical protein